jgi:hypothetical protein
VRYVYSAIKAGTFETWEAIFENNPAPEDDGVWVDEVTVRDTLVTPAFISNDEQNLGLCSGSGLSCDQDAPVCPGVETCDALPGCGVACNMVTAEVTADPGVNLGAPGQVVSISAINSVADRCLNGTLQYQFSVDRNDGGGTQLVRDWTDNPSYTDAPINTQSTWSVAVRCTSDETCSQTASIDVFVACPSTGAFGGPLTIVAPDKTQFTWAKQLEGAGNYSEGNLDTLSSSYTTNATGAVSLGATSHATVGNSTNLWVLIKSPTTGSLCNELGTWSSGSPSETGGDRDGTLVP